MKNIADYIKEGWVTILRTGNWTDRRKRQHHFDEDRLQQIADNYKQPLDFSLAPITATHDALPTTPNLGKIEELIRVGKFLLAKPTQLVGHTIKVLKDIGFSNVSTSLNPDNTLNHVALVPNPAVAGLGEFNEAALNFSSPGEDTIELLIEFSALDEDEIKKPGDQTKMWISAFLNNKVLKPKDQENLNKDEKEDQNMFDKIKKKKPGDDKPEDQNIDTADDSPGEENDGGDENCDFEAALHSANSKAANAEKTANELRIELEKMKNERRQKDVADFCDSLKPGVIIPKYRPGVERLLNVLAGVQDTYDFSADGKGEHQTSYNFAREFLGSLGSQIPLDPLKAKGKASNDDEIEFSDADKEEIDLHLKVLAIMNEKKCSYEEALNIADRR